MAKYDIDASPKIKEIIISQPKELQHEGRLRGPFRPGASGTAAEKKAQQKSLIAGTRKHGSNYSRARQKMTPSGHWAMYAYTVFIPDMNAWCLGVKFAGGYRCYYPNTASEKEENAYFSAIVNAESGSYWVWDNIVDQSLGAGYVEF